jgi:hypothetical protein
MEDHTARSLAGELGRHPASKNGALISRLSGIVSDVIAARVPDGATAAVALDEADEPVVVAVSEEGVIRLKALGDSSDDFHLTSELLRFDGPGAKSSVDEVALGDNSGGLFIRRAWLYELGDGRSLRVTIDQNSSHEDGHLEQALASAAGWPVA